MRAIVELTLREALRRRLLALGGLATLAVLVLTGAGDWRIAHLRIGGLLLAPAARRLFAAQFEILVWFMFSAVLAVGTAFLAAAAVAEEVESGVALAILARPLPRWAYVLGKAAGIAILALAYALLTGGGSWLLAWLLVGYRAPHPLWGVALVTWQATAVLALGLFLGTRWAAMTAAVVTVTAFFVAWLAGVVGGLATVLHNLWLMRVTTALAIVVPTDGLWRGAIAALESPALLALGQRQGLGAAANPFYVSALPAPGYLAWAGLWVAGILAAAVYTFGRRDL